MKKKFIITALILTIFGSNCFAFEFKKSETAKIRALLNNHEKALKEHNVNKVKTFYSAAYKNSDGFDLEDLGQILEKNYSTYENIKCKTKVHSITTFDDWAVAQVTDKTSAKLYPDKKRKNKEKAGILDGKTVYTIYLKKNKDDWEIVYDDILMEETSLKYGIANKIDMNLTTPLFVNQGDEYNLSLKMNKPDDIIALGSISREEIVYPSPDYQGKFRKIPPSGDLERLVHANKNNLDEYAIAYVGFTRVSINEQETRAKIDILGMAYLIKRVNMRQEKKFPQILVENN